MLGLRSEDLKVIIQEITFEQGLTERLIYGYISFLGAALIVGRAAAIE